MDLPDLVRKAYESHLQNPQAWLRSAWQLKRAACEIDTFSLPGFSNGPPDGPRGELALLMPVYRFLIGQSFEILLKGLLIAQGSAAGTGGRLAQRFHTHSLAALVKCVDKVQFPISAREERLLGELERFIQWAGRYPIPTRSDLYEIALSYSNHQHRAEAALWERIASYIKTCIAANSAGT